MKFNVGDLVRINSKIGKVAMFNVEPGFRPVVVQWETGVWIDHYEDDLELVTPQEVVDVR